MNISIWSVSAVIVFGFLCLGQFCVAGETQSGSMATTQNTSQASTQSPNTARTRSTSSPVLQKPLVNTRNVRLAGRRTASYSRRSNASRHSYMKQVIQQAARNR